MTVHCTFAGMQLSAGVHLMLILKWLGHSTFTPILDVYGDCIPAAAEASRCYTEARDQELDAFGGIARA
jgi:hypothetical protein